MFFWGLRVQAKNDLLQRLEAEAFSSEEVVVLNLPISIPYPMPNEGYESASGEVEYRGEFYHLVKQKIENDTLFMVCVKDQNQKQLQRTMNEFTNLANNLPATTKHAMDLLGKLFKDYTATSFLTLQASLALTNVIFFESQALEVINQSIQIDSPPPEAVFS